MKLATILLSLAMLSAWSVTAAPTAPEAADAAFAEIQAILAAKPPPELKSGSARFHWSTQQRSRLNDLCEKFMADFPTDPRRWEAAIHMFNRVRPFVKATDDAKLDQQRPGTIVQGAVVYDLAEQARWRERLADLDAQCLAATDMTSEVRKQYLLGRLIRFATELGRRVTEGQPIDLAAYKVEVDRAIATYPEERQTAEGFNRYVNLVRRQGASPEAIFAVLQEYLDSPSEGVRTIAETGLTLRKAQEHPLEWKFTAADGREVDLVKLRGKVVLVDFWATWCKPCVAEIPHIVEVYQKYHAQGFEVVGISLEQAGLRPGAPEAENARKLAASRQKLLDFTTARGMPWPQFFDGTGWKNPYTTEYGIRGIPRMFLLDQTGRVVTMDARGKKLEAEVRRLLKL
jgi:thiol-disulfide isomerase/thioredoxin